MKRILIGLLLLCLLQCFCISAYSSSMTVVYMGLTQEIGYSSDEWLKNDTMRMLLLVAVAVDISNEGIVDLLQSDMDLENAYVGQRENAVCIHIPTIKRDECLVVLYAPNDPAGVYRIISNDFDDAMLLNMAKTTMTNYRKADAETLEHVIEQLLSEL